MSPQSKREYFKAVWLRYKKAVSKAEKTKILDELCINCRLNRKYAIRRLRNFKIARRKKAKNKPGPKPKYQQPEFLAVLKEIWITSNLPCSKRLKAILPIWGFLPINKNSVLLNSRSLKNFPRSLRLPSTES